MVLKTPLNSSPCPSLKRATQAFGDQDVDLTNNCDPAPLQDTLLRNNPKDVNTTQLVANILALRSKATAGVDITEADMIPYSTVSSGNDSRIFIDREYFTEAVLPAIASAEQSIHIAMLSFDGGRLAHHVADMLIEKKRTNPDIEIRVIADNLESNALFPWSKGRKNLNRLKNAGIEVVFNNYFTEGMEHRKTIIVDSQKGFFGGSCFKDNYFGNETFWKAFDDTVQTKGLQAARNGAFLPKEEREESFTITPAMERPEYGDFGISLRGPVVHELQGGFLQSWIKQEQALNPELSDAQLKEKYFPPLPCSGDLPIKLTRGIPFGHGEMQQNLLSIIEGAEKTLDIEMAYLHVPAFSEALAKAARRGVQVRLISNSQKGIDMEASWHVNRQFYPQLLDAGVQIYELHKYSHRKFIVADNRMVFVSTGNPEFHSWQKAWDEIALIDSPDYAAEVVAKVIHPGLDPENSKEVSQADLDAESLWTRIKSAIFCFLFNAIARIYRLLVNPNLNNEKRVKLMTPAVERNQNRTHDLGVQGSVAAASPLLLARPAA